MIFFKRKEESTPRHVVELYIYTCSYCGKLFVGRTSREVETNARRHLKHKHNSEESIPIMVREVPIY
ncbi:MAG: hypothetical protein QW764_05370 [Desulfurococcaceae archaeon]